MSARVMGSTTVTSKEITCLPISSLKKFVKPA